MRQHGINKRRTWRKLHLGIHAATHRIEASIISTHDFQNGQLLPDLLNQVSAPITAVYANGAYDHQRCGEAIILRHATPYIPSRRRAKIKQHGHSKASLILEMSIDALCERALRAKTVEKADRLS